MPSQVYDEYNAWKKRNKLEDEEYTPDMQRKSEWVSIPNPSPSKPDYDRDFLLTGATGGKVPPAIMDRMVEPFKKRKQ